MYNSQYYTCEQIDERLLQGYLDDYNSQTGQSLTKAQFLTKLGSLFSKEGTIDNTLTQIGYYECDTAAGTAAKVITVANYSLFAGGSMKVKFVNKNTANNATLNINSQGAKALYYNGVRVSSTNTWDANEVVEIYYDGTSYYANNVKGSSGDGVFDISVYNLTEGQPTKYADLATALGPNGQNVPVQYRKGGMSVKFVLSSDNNYVQFRLMSDTFNTTVANWQGVDDEPTAGSDNLVKSGGVYEEVHSAVGSWDITKSVVAGHGTTIQIPVDLPSGTVSSLEIISSAIDVTSSIAYRLEDNTVDGEVIWSSPINTIIEHTSIGNVKKVSIYISGNLVHSNGDIKVVVNAGISYDIEELNHKVAENTSDINSQKDKINNIDNKIGYVVGEFTVDVNSDKTVNVPTYIQAGTLCKLLISSDAISLLSSFVFNYSDGTFKQHFSINKNELLTLTPEKDVVSVKFYLTQSSIISSGVCKYSLYYNSSLNTFDNINQLNDYNKIQDEALLTGLPTSITKKLIFYGKLYGLNNQSCTNLLNNGGSIGVFDWGEGRYLDASSVPNITKNTERDWEKKVSENELIRFDFDSIFVDYTDSEPYYIKQIAIADSSFTFTESEIDILHKVFRLPLFRSNSLNPFGVWKLNRKLGNMNLPSSRLLDNTSLENARGYVAGNNWTLANKVASCNDPNAEKSTLTYQLNWFSKNAKYLIVYNISEYTSGHLNVSVTDSSLNHRTAAGMLLSSQEFIYNGTSAQPTLTFKAEDDGFVGVIDFVEIVRIG